MLIAGKLSQGVDIQRILDDIRDKLGQGYSRIHLLTRKDISNIEKAYCSKGIQRHQDDATSIHLWVEDMRTQQDNPVLLYKPQSQLPTPDCADLSKQDFVLAIQTPLQADIMKRLSKDRVICVDSTHGTTGYDFPLITVLIVDEYGEGFPVAWCIANREDQTLLQYFFQALKQKVGTISPQWFMSDLAEQYWSAWVSTFRQPLKRLLCVWHIDHAWRENLKQMCDELKVQVYHNLRVLLEETDCNKFEILLERTIQTMEGSADTAQFGQYFRQYAKRKEEWATCYRKDALVNTNMYVESFHRVLKYVYLKGKVNKRADKCVGMLLKLARDKGYERLVKLEKGKNSERINTIRARHQASLNMPLSLVHTTEEYATWEVESSDTKHTYSVCEENKQCPYGCSLGCVDCHICVHQYTCTCPDSLIKSTICKHIHLVIRAITTDQTERDDPLQHSPMDRTEEAILLKNFEGPTHTPSMYRDGLHDQLSTLTSYVNTTKDMEVLRDVKALLTSAINLMKANVNIPASLPLAKPEPPNKNIATQRSFYSTKRKRKPAKVRIAKPTREEKNDICKVLLKGSTPSPLSQGNYSKLRTHTLLDFIKLHT